MKRGRKIEHVSELAILLRPALATTGARFAIASRIDSMLPLLHQRGSVSIQLICVNLPLLSSHGQRTRLGNADTERPFHEPRAGIAL